jgi:hypothetical protein
MTIDKAVAAQAVADEDDAGPAEDIVWIEYEDMTEAQRRIVDAGDTVGGEIPLGLSSEERFAWLMERFGGRRGG